MKTRILTICIVLISSFNNYAQSNYQDILINEIVASNDSTSGNSDNDVEYDDYIEIYNNTNVAFLLNNFYLSDSLEFPTKWKFPDGTILNANDYLVIWCDNDSSNFKGLHTNFKLRKNGDDITISSPTGNLIDQVVFGLQQTAMAYSRFPNASSSFTIKRGTPKANNDIEIAAKNENIVINELMADSDSLSNIAEPDGGFPDWIELYNKANVALSLNGYYLSDDENLKTKWTFPANTQIEANGYLILWTDKDVHQNGIHTNFKLNASGESLFFYNNDLTLNDNVSFGIQTTNFSYARQPNGTGSFATANPTFAANNDLVSIETTDFANKIKIYPTLADNYIFVKSNKFNLPLKIYNSSGKLVFLKEITNEITKIAIQNLTKGTYFAVVNKQMYKFVKK